MENGSLRKKPTFKFLPYHHWFPHKIMPEKQLQKSILMRRNYPDLCNVPDWLKFASTNEKHYPDLGSDTSSVWHLSGRFSQIILWVNQWWCHRMSVIVFSGQENGCRARK